MPVGVRKIIGDLAETKVRFGTKPAQQKRAILTSLRRRRIVDPADLIAYHEALCFLRAFPDGPRILASSERELRTFARRVRSCKAENGGELPEELVDSGIVGTPYHYPYGLPMADWLTSRFDDAADVDWDAYGEIAEDPLAAVVPVFASWTETGALDDEALTMQAWFSRARGRGRIGMLRWLVRRLRASGLPEEVQETLFAQMNLPIRWELGSSDASRTLARMPERAPFFQEGPLQGRTRDLRATLKPPIGSARPVSRARGRAWIDLARCALSVRERELYPLALASDAEVYETRVGHGTRIVRIGMRPDRRLPLEADYAGFVVRNGVPIGYAVAVILFDRVEIAVNIYPTFRQGESSFVFEQFARVLHHQFGSRILFVERYQLGHENDEGLDAGSFWFYYKLGFRPVDRAVAALAAKEAARIAAKPGHRSSRAMLRRLARSNVVFRLGGSSGGLEGGVDLTALGFRTSRFVEDRFGGDRNRAEETCAGRLVRTLGIRGFARWTAEERSALRRLSPLIVQIHDLSRWPAGDRRGLAEILKSKGGVREDDCARMMGENGRLLRALRDLARRR